MQYTLKHKKDTEDSIEILFIAKHIDNTLGPTSTLATFVKWFTPYGDILDEYIKWTQDIIQLRSNFQKLKAMRDSPEWYNQLGFVFVVGMELNHIYIRLSSSKLIWILSCLGYPSQSNPTPLQSDKILKNYLTNYKNPSANNKRNERTVFTPHKEFELAQIAIAHAESDKPLIVNAHTLIKISKFKYQYLVGTSAEVDKKINNRDIIFYDQLDTISDDYQDRITTQMKDKVGKHIRHLKNGFTYKPNNEVELDEIVAIYTNAHA